MKRLIWGQPTRSRFLSPKLSRELSVPIDRPFKRRTLLTACLCTGTVLSGCIRQDENKDKWVEGVLLSVESRDISQVESFTLQDEHGEHWRFHVAVDAMSDPRHPITAAHLRLHLTLVHRLIVEYRVTDAGLAAYRVDDVPRG